MRLSILLIILSPLFIAACAHEITTNQRPAWIDSPGDYVVGKCGTHIRGLIAQEQCAYKNGLSYIAISKGVSVDVAANIKMRQRSDQKTGSSYGELQSTVGIDEKDIKISARIIDKWRDRVNDIVYVLIEEN